MHAKVNLHFTCYICFSLQLVSSLVGGVFLFLCYYESFLFIYMHLFCEIVEFPFLLFMFGCFLETHLWKVSALPAPHSN